MQVELLGTLALIDGKYVLLSPKADVPGFREKFVTSPGCSFQISWGSGHHVTFSEETVVGLPEFRPLIGTVRVPVFASVEEADVWLTNLNQ
jgi:hypothetical protein